MPLLVSHFTKVNEQIFLEVYIGEIEDYIEEDQIQEEYIQEEYIGEIGRRIHERICDHSQKDSKSYMLKHSLENNHKRVSFKDFCIL